MPRGEPRWRAEAEQTFLRELREREQREAQEEPVKVGSNPHQPWHPLFNPVPRPRRSDLSGYLLEEVHAKERADCTKEFDEALKGITEGRWTTRKEIAAFFGRPDKWAGGMVRMMIDRNHLSADDVKRCLTGLKGKKTGKRKPQHSADSQTNNQTINTPKE